ncbi:MAG: GNAT family N-acetyltransferase [Bacteroidia bacterium]|nr:MAG: GNAT family N-acetyltransferase [Bacteroidia bacterium]
METVIRKAVKEDVPMILKFIKELAEYEKLAHQVQVTGDVLAESLFGSRPYAEVIFAVIDGKEAGFALFFNNFSTFLGKPGIYIEDLYIIPEYRGRGVGRELLRFIASIAVENGFGRVEWWVLNWNPARKFYEKIGAESMDEWVVYRLTGEKLIKLAGETTSTID